MDIIVMIVVGSITDGMSIPASPFLKASRGTATWAKAAKQPRLLPSCWEALRLEAAAPKPAESI